MEDPLLQVSSWLNAQSNQEVLIQKEEDGDIDRTRIQVDHVSMGHLQQKDPDGYVANQSILVHGQGKVLFTNYEAHLPQNVYEIPLEQSFVAHSIDEGLQIKTGRATYTLLKG
jgi:hypothetical protein